MGRHRKNGYSADVGAFFVANGVRHKLAKTNGVTLVFAEPTTLARGIVGELVLAVDGNERSRTIRLPEGARNDVEDTEYRDVAPF
jgi:hypothetical protein